MSHIVHGLQSGTYTNFPLCLPLIFLVIRKDMGMDLRDLNSWSFLSRAPLVHDVPLFEPRQHHSYLVHPALGTHRMGCHLCHTCTIRTLRRAQHRPWILCTGLEHRAAFPVIVPLSHACSCSPPPTAPALCRSPSTHSKPVLVSCSEGGSREWRSFLNMVPDKPLHPFSCLSSLKFQL